MKLTQIPQKAEALRTALKTALKVLAQAEHRTDWQSLVGLASRAPRNPKPRFKTEDDLWE